MADITLSKAVRSNLLNLQSTSELMSKTQERLSTGLKVNSALDNPTNFFTASSLKARSSDLGNLLDSVSNAIQTVDAADNGIKAITKLVQSAQSTARQALQDRTNSSVTQAAGATAVDGALTKAAAEAKTLVADVGFAAGQTLSFSTTNSSTGVNQSFSYTITAGSTVQDLVQAVNSSGVATAQVSTDGKLSFATEGANNLVISGSAPDPDGDLVPTNFADAPLTNLGFTPTGGTNWVTNGVGTDVATYTQAAAGSTASASRAGLANQFNDLLGQIDKLAEDSGYNGINLLGGVNENLKLAFNEDGSSSITIQGVDFSSTGLGLTATTNDFDSDAEINAKLQALSDGLSTLRSQASKFGSNLSVIETRQDFTKNMINTLETGAANLTLADTNEEAANMLALQTRQQLSSTALSLASQADQQVLRLF